MLAMVLSTLWVASALAVTYATIVGGWLRLRSGPSYNSTIITSYRNGTVVTVLSNENGWARVQTPDFRVGYMDARYLNIGYSPVVPTVTPATRTWTDVNRTAYVTSANGRGVRLRSAPIVNSSNVTGLYPVGRTVLEIRRSSDGWSYIKIDKKYGYMMSQYLSSSHTPVYPPAATTNPLYPATPTQPPQPTMPSQPGLPGGVSTVLPTETPSPASVGFTSVKVDPYQPTVGDTLKVMMTPAEATYSVIWYNELGTPLGTKKSYKTVDTDVGHIISCRVIGTGDYAGQVADAKTGTVKAAE